MGGMLRQAMGTAMQVGQRVLAGESIAFRARCAPSNSTARARSSPRRTPTVDFGIAFQGGRTGMKGGEGFVLDKFTGHGTMVIAGAATSST